MADLLLAASKRNVGRYPLTLQRADNGRRAVTSIRRRFTNGDPISSLNPPQLAKVVLVVMPCASGDFGIQDDTAIGINALMHLILQLSRCAFLLGQCGFRIGATGVRLVGHASCR